jgi:hypothetical protein
MLKISDSNVKPGPMMVKVDFSITPLAGMPEFIVNIQGECMFHPHPTDPTVEVLDWEYSVPGKPELASSEIQSSVALLVPTIVKDVEEAMTQLVRDQMDTPDTTTPEVTGVIDWTAVQRAFAEEFDLNAALIEAAENVDSDNVVDDMRLDGYGSNYQVVVDLDPRAIGDSMEDSMEDALSAWFRQKAASSAQ